MITGIGIDLTDIARIKKAYEKRPSFAEKVLTPAELSIFENYQGKRQWEFLAGRFAAKEAFTKALGTGIGKVGLQDITVLNDEKGKPYVVQTVTTDAVHISITHTDTVAAAEVILEQL